MSVSEPDRYAVVGFPVSHSWSPFIHGLFAQNTGQNLVYRLLEIPPERFATDVGAFFAAGARGVNVTVPHKQAAADLVKYRTPRAEIAGAVNTISNESGDLLGDNTDGAGLVNDLVNNLHLRLADMRILLLGAGGAARGVLGPLLGCAPGLIQIANRNEARAAHLANEFRSLGDVRYSDFEAVGRNKDLPPFDLIINATSASLQDIVPPIGSKCIGDNTICYDMVYGKNQTAFVRWAYDHGAARACVGWGMLIEQAAEAFYLWRGVRPDTKPVMDAILKSPSSTPH
jgi:shikimate dehydrogenase